jgi:surface polysaccharide O-acyltransferase-like enzyme
MTEILIFTLNAIFIYLFSDWIIRKIEEIRGKVLKQRQIVFFFVFLTLALVSFQILRTIFGTN